MRVIITGATSMIGASLVRKCIEENDEVIALVRCNSSRMNRIPYSDKVRIVEYDINKNNHFQFEECKADVFFHFAWAYTSKETRDNPLLQEKNIKSSLDMVELARKCGCTRFVGAGSQAEYGVVSNMIDEQTVANPKIAYGMAKLSTYMLTKKLCNQYGIEHIWGRVFSVYGTYDNDNTLINYVIDSFNRREVPHLSSCNQIWNYLNEIDVGNIFYLLGMTDVEDGTYCIAHRESKPLREYIEIIRSLYGEDLNCEYDTESLNDNVVQLQVDTKKLYSSISYEEKVSFIEGIRAVIDYRNTKRFNDEKDKCNDSLL